MGDRHAERRLEAEHPGRGLVERLFLRLAGMRCMVGGDRIDRAVGEARPHGVDVGTGAQRRVDLERRVVGSQAVRR